jgi:hypothetical protein
MALEGRSTQAIDPARIERSFAFLPVLDPEVPDLLRGDGLDEEVRNLEVGQDGHGKIHRLPPLLVAYGRDIQVAC